MRAKDRGSTMLARTCGQCAKVVVLLCLAQPTFGGSPVPVSLVRIADNSSCHRGDDAMTFRDLRAADSGAAFQVPSNHVLLVTDLIVTVHAQTDAANSVVLLQFGAQQPSSGVETEQLAINVPVDAGGHGGAKVHLSTGIRLVSNEQLCAWWKADPAIVVTHKGPNKPISVLPVIHAFGMLQVVGSRPSRKPAHE